MLCLLFASLLRKEKQNCKEKILHMLNKLFVTHIVKQIQWIIICRFLSEFYLFWTKCIINTLRKWLHYENKLIVKQLR